MTQINNEAQTKLIPLAFDLNNRIWMEGYVLCFSFLENAAQILQIQIMDGRGFETMIEYDIELNTHINQVLNILNQEQSITPDMTVWVMSLLNYMLYLKNIVFNPDPDDLIKFIKPLQIVKLNIKESRVLMEGALTWVDKKMMMQ
jgi:hypothetical protein